MEDIKNINISNWKKVAQNTDSWKKLFEQARTLNWLGHVEGMAGDNIVQNIKRRKPMYKRPIGRPKTRWEGDVLEDIKSINIGNWKEVAQNGESWKKVGEQARTLYSLYRL